MKLFKILPLIMFSLLLWACNPATNEKTAAAEVISEASGAEVYYFHYTRRCATCNAVEDVTKNTLNEAFADKVNSGDITFTSVNLDEKDGETLANKLEVAGQALVFIVNGQKTDLTDVGFMYAKSEPEKLKKEILATVNKAFITN